ncbi:type VI secretion system baseplate subunit TssF [Marinospirillum minutulum]|uniref:type VI secretion system baseplate subunit TssF n=1 Tax=Marinospirillum minutulum TaxID=64974 RepID=UPI0004198E22|nr:type VI secretion system baseplate subunit TssF [Marinospirillum minutulum]
MFDQHYRDELHRLRQLATNYADKEPELARHLIPGSDPDVERLLEGVAFLTAGLRDQLDREAPRFTRNLLEILDPTRLQALVSTTLVGFTPRPSLKAPEVLPKGTPLGNQPNQGKLVEFTSRHACRVSPLEITECTVSNQQANKQNSRCLSLKLNCLAGGLGAILADHPLNLHLVAPLNVGADLHWLLLHATSQLEVLFDGQIIEGVVSKAQPLDLPLQEEHLPGEAAILNYLHLPEAAMALAIHFDGLDERNKAQELTLNFWLDESQLSLPKVKKEYFQLHCVAANNQFLRQLPSFLKDARQLLQPLLPRSKKQETLLVHSIQKIEGQYASEDQSHTYLPYWEVEEATDKHAYQLHSEQDLLTGLPTYRLLLTQSQDELSNKDEVIRVSAWCSNGQAAAQLLPGDLSTHLNATPETVSFTNLTTSTAWKAPKLDPASERQQVAELSRGNTSLFSRNGLLQRLQEMAERISPDDSRLAINQKKLDAIQKVTVRATEKLLEQSLFRGLEMSLSINFQAFNSKGDALGFCSRLDRFLAQMTPINHFSALYVIDANSGEDFTWSPKLNTQILG